MFFGGIIAAIVLFAVSSLADEFGEFPAGILGLVYVASGALLFFPARFIYSFGSKVRNYLLSRSNEDLEQAFKNNKSFWKFCGIYSIVCLAFIPLGIIISVIVMISSVFL
jgi:beta-lactamase regulating signal transducer with metallopeptidase domain